MALETAESTFDPFAQDSRMEPAPDSSPIRVSLNTQFESGIPPARDREERSLAVGVERLDLALAHVTRTEANLGLLIRGLKHLAAGASAAREANTELTHELDELRAHLTRSHEQEHTLRFRMNQLEQLLDVVRHEGAREREFLVEQQDLFLVEVLSDHDRQVDELRRMLREANSGSSRQREIDELIAQRDQARDYATRCEHERDAAWHELANSEATPVPATVARYTEDAPTIQPPPMPAGSTASAEDHFSEVSDDELRGSSPRAVSNPSATAIGSISLRAVQVPVSHVSASKHALVDVDDGSDRPTSSYSLSGEEISD